VFVIVGAAGRGRARFGEAWLGAVRQGRARRGEVRQDQVNFLVFLFNNVSRPNAERMARGRLRGGEEEDDCTRPTK